MPFDSWSSRPYVSRPNPGELMTDSSARAEGNLECTGVRPQVGMTKQPCGVHLHYTILAQYKAGSHSQK